jgi:transcriptional regulator with XRE-family HTH domain
VILRLRKLREELHRSQQDLAGAVGITRAAISHWECGRKLPPLAMIPRLADALGVPEALLLHLDTHRHPDANAS